MKRILVLAAALLLSASPLVAAELGRVQFNGRNIILNDDNTWSYATPADTAQSGAPLDCGGHEPAVSATIKFAACFDPAVWEAADPVGEQEFLMFSKDGKTAVTVITETTVIPMDAYQDAIISASAAASGVAKEAIATTDVGTVDYANHTWGTFRYILSVEGTAFAYLNYHVSDPDVGSVQVVFWTVPGDEALSKAQAEALLGTVTFGD